MYFWEGIKLRYPEYGRKQKSIEEILTEMRRKRAENSEVSEMYPNKGTDRFYRAYVEVQKANIKQKSN